MIAALFVVCALFGIAFADKVQIIQDYNGKYRFAILNGEGEALLTSTTSFASQDECVTSVAAAVQRGGSADSFVSTPKTVTDSYYSTTTFYVLELTDASGTVICESSNLASTTIVDDIKTAVVTVCSAGPTVVKQDNEELRVGKFEIFQDVVGQWRFRLKAGNGEIILVSEAYTRKGSAYKGIRSVKTNSIAESNFKKEQSSANQPYFNLVAQNNEIIGTSEMYSSTSARQVGISSVMRNAALAPIVDLMYGKPAAGPPKFVLYQAEYGDYSWRLQATDNTQAIVQGYLYATKAEAQSALDSYKTASSDAANWVPFTETLGYATRTRYVISTSSTGYTAGEAIGYTAFAEQSYLDAVKTAVTTLDYNTVTSETQWTTRNGRFTIFCGKDAQGENTGKFYFHLQAANYEIILASQAYTAKSSAQNGIDSVKTNAAMMSRFVNKEAVDGKPYFVLKAGNGQVIGVSETYSSNAARAGGIDSVMRNIANAEIVDNAQNCQAPPVYPDECEVIYGMEVCSDDSEEEEGNEYRKDGTSAANVVVGFFVSTVAFVALF